MQLKYSILSFILAKSRHHLEHRSWVNEGAIDQNWEKTHNENASNQYQSVSKFLAFLRVFDFEKIFFENLQDMIKAPWYDGNDNNIMKMMNYST